MKTKIIWIPAGVLAALVVALFALAAYFKPVTHYIPVPEIDRMQKASGDLTDCFWFASVYENSLANYAYPDSGANYWVSQFKLPPGARLDFTGDFPHARHMSFNSYDDIGQPADRLNDTMIVPEKAATNPFLEGAQRDAKERAYAVHVQQANVHAGADMTERDSARPLNTLYVPTESSTVQILLRIYVPDKGLSPKGGVNFPRPTMTLADGRKVDGEELCKAIVIKEHSLRDIHLTMQAAKLLLSLKSALTSYHPAQPVPQWRAFFNQFLFVGDLLDGTTVEGVKHLISGKRKGGFFSTLDNTYMVSYVDNRLGDELVIQGLAPTTPKTLEANPVMHHGQLRYWSVCKYRSIYDTAVDYCLFDEQVPLKTNGEYTIVFSTPELRPANAKPECGVAWRPWGVGDGIDNPRGGLVVMRNMMPAADFHQSIFDVKEEGAEKEALGPYYPRSAYEAKAAFEARGCPVKS